MELIVREVFMLILFFSATKLMNASLFYISQLLGYRIFRWLFNFTFSWLFNFTKFWWYKVTYYTITRMGNYALCPPICRLRSFIVAPSAKLLPFNIAFFPKSFLMCNTASCTLAALSCFSSACCFSFSNAL